MSMLLFKTPNSFSNCAVLIRRIDVRKICCMHRYQGAKLEKVENINLNYGRWYTNMIVSL